MNAPDFAPPRPTRVTVVIDPAERTIRLHAETHGAIDFSPSDARQAAELLLRAADALAVPGEDGEATEFAVGCVNRLHAEDCDGTTFTCGRSGG